MLYEYEEEDEADEPADEGDEPEEESLGRSNAIGLGVVDHLAGGNADVVVLLAPVPKEQTNVKSDLGIVKTGKAHFYFQMSECN